MGVAKFALGAWLVLLLIPLLIGLMWAIGRHYQSVEAALAVDPKRGALPRRVAPRVLVPVSRIDRATLNALAFATSTSGDVTAIHVSDDAADVQSMRRRVGAVGRPRNLVILESPHRALMARLMAYIEATDRGDPNSRPPSWCRSSSRATSGSTRSITRPPCG